MQNKTTQNKITQTKPNNVKQSRQSIQTHITNSRQFAKKNDVQSPTITPTNHAKYQMQYQNTAGTLKVQTFNERSALFLPRPSASGRLLEAQLANATRG